MALSSFASSSRSRSRSPWLIPLALILTLLLAAGLAVRIWLGHHPEQAAKPIFKKVVPLVVPTPFGGVASVGLLAGDGHSGKLDRSAGSASSARFSDPYGLALSATGVLFVADGGDNNSIRRVLPSGEVSTWAGSGVEGWRDGPAAQAAFHTPSGLALDRQGNLLVADTGNHLIRKITPEGVVSTLAGDGQPGWRDGAANQARFNGPLGVAVDGQGRVYVADSYNDRIRVISPQGQVSTLAGGMPGYQDGQGEQARFDMPTALALDAQGQLWVSDARNNALRRITPEGQVSTLLRTDPDLPADEDKPLWRPMSIAVAHDGFLYVGVQRNGALLQVSPAGEVHVLSRGPSVRFGRITGLALDPAGPVYLADAASYRVHRLLPQMPSAELPNSVLAAGAGAVAGVGPASDLALPATAQRWPVQPQLSWHEVVGTPGEVRGNYRGESRDHLHEGLDVRGDVGSEVLAIADAKVASPLATWALGAQGEGLALDRLSYIHMKVGRDAKGRVFDPARFLLQVNEAGKPERMRVRRGTRFAAGDKLGSINSMAHVHLALGVGGYQLNPLQLGFAGMRDTVAPVIEAVALYDVSGRKLGAPEPNAAKPAKPGKGSNKAQAQAQAKLPARLQVQRDEAGLQIVVEAWDQVDDNEPRRRLGLHSLGYQVLLPDGQPAPGFEQPRMTQSFDRMPVDDEAVKLIYAPSSGITVHGAAVTRFRYVATNSAIGGQVSIGRWLIRDLPAGDYILRIHAQDFSGNKALRGRDVAVTLY
ncbi:NHL repeat-containing protein [Paucibacter sp. KCTC 42545]|uniref:NHL repeat-containing protein n=1 Tax=Paucibacter sp. KCTC 42545 TaxID=1768242 RepID=UPI0009EB223E|nr:NHL repeat-containing protein [Paucibacter sp. KCTC 42545]